jgi:hypothetical protein
MNQKMKGALILGLLLIAVVASMGILSASAAKNGDLDQTRDRTKDCLQDKDCLQTQDGTCDQIKDQLRTKLQIRDC